LRKSEEQLFIAKKELDKQKSKLEAFTNATSTAREGTLQAHIDKCMVRNDVTYQRRSTNVDRFCMNSGLSIARYAARIPVAR
jgi:hypothetical protein